jgi:integrase/recombinase XerD
MAHPNSIFIWQNTREAEGPLALYFELFAGFLQDQGYRQSYRERQLRLAAYFNRWLKEERIDLHALTSDHVARFLPWLSKYRHRGASDASALRCLLQFLCQHGISVKTADSPQLTAIEQVSQAYRSYLCQQRNLSDVTVAGYLPFIRAFLTARFNQAPIDFSVLSAADVVGFIRHQATRLLPIRAKTAATALRSFLGYLRYRGEIHSDLAAAVPAVPMWTLTGIPRAIAANDAQAVLAHCRRDTPIGSRDYAILLLLARLGLRAGEIVSLTLDSIDWISGSLTVIGESGQFEPLPLLGDVGAAIANYLQHGRPKSSHRALFLRAQAPHRGFSGPSTVSTVVRLALARAGIACPRKGAHQFRHALACQMLRQGATLTEIGTVLRHRNLQTTAIYAKVDLVALRTLSQPWPGGAR